MLAKQTRRGARTFYSAAQGGINSLAQARSRGAPIDLHPEIEDALTNNRPVVALETTIVTHGMPYSTNLTTARSVEEQVRKAGAVPATIGLIAGRVKIGLHAHELERLADVKNNPGAVKMSRRDLGPAIAAKKDAGTTCSTTLILAALAGIKVFSTGGLGGVHRGGESSMDISADLQDLTRCPVGLVSAGVKSILDIGRTLEYLESLGVPVVTYGQTNDFPAFYSRTSGFKSPWNTNDAATAAKILHTQRQFGMSTGALFAAPIPEPYETIGQEIQASVEQAVRESEENGMSKCGKEATPWLLKRVAELTSGKSLASNVALIENTARIGGEIAVAYAKLAGNHKQDSGHQPYIPTQQSAAGPTQTPAEVLPSPKIMVIGSAAIDINACSASSSAATHQSTSPGEVTVTLGGVGRNVAEATHRVLSTIGSDSSSVQLVSAVGDDAFSGLLKKESEKSGMRLDGLVSKEGRTAVCNLVLDSEGALVGGVADMNIVEMIQGVELVTSIKEKKPVIVALDGNLSIPALTAVVKECVRTYTPIFFEPTSVPKAVRILPALEASIGIHTGQSMIALAAPNKLELSQLYHSMRALSEESPNFETHVWETLDTFLLLDKWRMDVDLVARQSVSDLPGEKRTLSFLTEEGVAQMAINLLPLFQRLVIKLGDQGVLLAMRLSGEEARRSEWVNLRTNPRQRLAISVTQDEIIVLQHFPGLQLDGVVNSTGAGDSLMGALLAQALHDRDLWLDPGKVEQALNLAQRAACETLQSKLSVSPALSQLSTTSD